MSRLLDVKNLKVSFDTYAGTVQAIRGVSFTLNEGETLAIVGESGCGKTVTSKTIMGLIQKPGYTDKSSEILFEGDNILSYSERKWQKFRGSKAGMIFQDPMTALDPTMKIGFQIAEVIMLHKKLSKKQAMEEAVNILKLVNVPNAEKRLHQYPHEFSGGMRQRIVIAIALACNPKILIADEPTTALDVTIQADVLDLLKELKEKTGTSIIIITHDFGVVAGIADRIAVMYAGKIVETGTVFELFKNPKHPYTSALLQSVPRLDLDNKQELMSIPGIPPDLIAPPKGCAFASRCKDCMKICQQMEPEITEISNDHRLSCWLMHPYALNNPGVEK